MRLELTDEWTQLYTLVDGASASTQFKIQVTSGRVQAATGDEPETNDGYQFSRSESFTFTPEFGDLWVKSTGGTSAIEVDIADTGFSGGVTPFNGATGSSTGGGGSSETPASITQKYESNSVAKIQKAIESASHQIIGSVLTTTYTTFDGTELQTSVNIPSTGGGGEDHDAVVTVDNIYASDQLITRVTLQSGAVVESEPVTIQTTAPVGTDGSLVKIVNGELVASEVAEENGSIAVAPQSIKIGAHKLSSVGDALGSMNLATDQQRVLVYQDLTGGVVQRPYAYTMSSDEWRHVETIPDESSAVTKSSEQIAGMVDGGYYIIKPNTIGFTLDDPIDDFLFTIFDANEQIFKGKYSGATVNQLLDHEAIIIDGAADISFSVTDTKGAPIAVMGNGIASVQKFMFTLRQSERSYIAYEGEGNGDGGEYPKNPVFETVVTESFAGIDANRFVSFLNEKVAIESDTSIDIKIEGSDAVTIDTDEINAGFKEVVDIQSGSKPASAVNLAQVQSMLKNLFLQRVDVTLANNVLDLGSDFAGKNVFVSGAGLESSVILNASNFSDYQVVQITRSSEYENAALPLQLVEEDREVRYLVQGTTSFGVFDGRWLVLSDATVTLAEVTQRAAFQQYVSIRAGQGMVSAIDQFGVMTLNVVPSGGDTPSFEIDDNTVPIIIDKLPAPSAISVEFDQLVSPYGQIVAGHIMDSRGEVLAVNSHSAVTQPIDTIGRYSNPKIFKEVDLEQPSTFINTNFHNEGIVHPSGQEIVVHSEDYIWVRTEPDSIHFRTGKIIHGYLFSIVDQLGSPIYKHKSSDSHNSSAVVHIKCSSLTLRANKSYRFIVTDLDGNLFPLLGSDDVQAWVFNYCNLTQHGLLTDQDSVLPDIASFMHVKTLQITDHTQASGLTFNSNGTIEVDGQLNLQNNHIIELSAAEHDHEATNLGQVKNLIANADFTGTISIDGQEVEDIQLNEDDFIYSYNEFTKVLHLNTKQSNGGGSADGTVNPIVSDNLMTGYLTEFASEDGKFIRSSNVKWSDIQSEHERIWDKLDPAYKTSITAQTEAAANTLTIAHLKHEISQMHRDITHNNVVNDDQYGSLSRLRVEDSRQDKHLNTLDIDHQATRTTVSNHQVSIETLTSDYVTLQGQTEAITEDLTALDTQVTTIASFPLERLAAGEFEETLSVADSFDTLSSTSSHYMTPRGSEVEYHLPPDARTVEPSYTIGIKVDGVRTEVLKAQVGTISAVNNRMIDLADGIDDNDAVTVGQIKEYLQQIGDRLDLIEAEIGISIPPTVFNVYSGRIETNATSDPDVIKNCGFVEENVTEQTLLAAPGNHLYRVQAHDPEAENPTFSMIAYPKSVLTPNPMRVRYSNFVADWNHFEIIIDGVRYIVLIAQMPDTNPSINALELVQ